MNSIDAYSDAPRINIRDRLRAHQRRQVHVARLSAPADWQGELRQALAAHREPDPLWFSYADAKLFLHSFAVFFVATWVFFS
jgi:hypothetical protein